MKCGQSYKTWVTHLVSQGNTFTSWDKTFISEDKTFISRARSCPYTHNSLRSLVDIAMIAVCLVGCFAYWLHSVEDVN